MSGPVFVNGEPKAAGTFGAENGERSAKPTVPEDESLARPPTERGSGKEAPEELAAEVLSVADAMEMSLSENTRAAYRRGWRRFTAYCEEVGRDPMSATPEDVARFLVTLASESGSRGAGAPGKRPLAVGTLGILVAAIRWRYSEAGRVPPTSDPGVKQVLQGLRRRLGGRQRQVSAIREHKMARILAHCDERTADARFRTIATRDAALIAIGFAAALRRSEICALQFEDLEFLDPPDGPPHMFVHIRRSKTDQFGEGKRVPVPEGNLVRPIARLKEWLALAGIAGGPVFPSMRRGGAVQGRAMHPSDVARLVKHYVQAIGLDPTDYAGHSLRVGFVTSAAAHRARLDKIMAITRHKSPGMVLRYIRDVEAFDDHPGDAFL